VRHQGHGAERLDQVVVGAELQAANVFHLIASSRQHQDRDVRNAPNVPQDVETAAVR
jgi:hypothetical protein